MTYFTCPHCGKKAQTARTDIERVDVNGEPFWFIASGTTERHIDERLCCDACYAKHDDRPRNERGEKQGPHRFGTRFHGEVRLASTKQE
jgi:rubredoxin